jgi:hypothetical protein
VSHEAVTYIKNLKVCPNGEQLTFAERLIALLVADYYQHADGCFASLETLTSDGGMSKRYCQALIAALETKKLVIKDRPKSQGRGKLTCLRFPEFDKRVSIQTPFAVPEKGDHTDTIPPNKGVHTDTLSSDANGKGRTKGDQKGDQKGDHTAFVLSDEHEHEQGTRSGAAQAVCSGAARAGGDRACARPPVDLEAIIKDIVWAHPYTHTGFGFGSRSQVVLRRGWADCVRIAAKIEMGTRNLSEEAALQHILSRTKQLVAQVPQTKLRFLPHVVNFFPQRMYDRAPDSFCAPTPEEQRDIRTRAAEKRRESTRAKSAIPIRATAPEGTLVKDMTEEQRREYRRQKSARQRADRVKLDEELAAFNAAAKPHLRSRELPK